MASQKNWSNNLGVTCGMVVHTKEVGRDIKYFRENNLKDCVPGWL